MSLFYIFIQIYVTYILFKVSPIIALIYISGVVASIFLGKKLKIITGLELLFLSTISWGGVVLQLLFKYSESIDDKINKILK